MIVEQYIVSDFNLFPRTLNSIEMSQVAKIPHSLSVTVQNQSDKELVLNMNVSNLFETKAVK